MKNKGLRNRLAAVLVSAGVFFSFAGCGSAEINGLSVSDTTASFDSAKTEAAVGGEYYSEDYYDDAGMEYSTAETTAENETFADTDRKLIKTVDMQIETKEFDMVVASLEDKVSELGGYIESMDTYNGSKYTHYTSERNASMTIRIPQEKLNDFLNVVSEISNVVRRSDNVEDVTLSYVDLESHKKVLQAEHDRLLELLEAAETIEDILTIESRLSDVRYQLESMESQLRTYDNKINYSTIYLDIDEVEVLTPVAEESIGQRISSGFAESLQDIGEDFVEFVIWFVVNIPYLVIFAIVIVVIVLIFKALIKRAKAKSAANPKPEFVYLPDSPKGREQQTQQNLDNREDAKN